VATAATFSAAWLAGMSMAFDALEQPDGTLRNPLQADLSSLLPFLLACIPPVLAAGAAAAGALSVVRSRPAALGLTAGVQVALGMVGLLHQLFQRQAGLLALLGWALLGAGLAVAAWRLFFAKAGSPASPLQRKASVDPELAAVLMAEGSGRFSSGGEAAEGNGVQQRLQAQQRSGSSWDLLDGKQQQGQQGGVFSPAAAAAGMPSSIDSNGFVQVPGPPLPFAASYQAAASSRPGSTASAYNEPYSRDANHSPEGILHLYSEAARLPGLVTVPSEAYKHVGVQPLLPYTLLVLLGYLLPYGMTVAAAVTTNLDGSSQLALPLALLALPLGGAVAGLLCFAFSLSRQVVVALSAAMYSIAPITAACILVTLPVGVVPMEEISYGSDATQDRLSMVAAGAMIAAGLLVCWPAAGRTNGSRAGAGAVVGAAASVFISVLLGALCLGSPYCLVSAS
jgi:zinc transporter ZupT